MWRKIVLGALILTLGLTMGGLVLAVDTDQQNKPAIERALNEILSKECPRVEPAGAAAVAERKVSEDIDAILVVWIDYSIFFRRIYYALTIGIVLFGGLATALYDGDVWYKKWKTAAAILVTLSGGLNSALMPYSEHKKFDEAWVVLNTVKAAYLTNPSVTLCDLGKAYAYGESIIHKGG